LPCPLYGLELLCLFLCLVCLPNLFLGLERNDVMFTFAAIGTF
jgi:hypothetical protein